MSGWLEIIRRLSKPGDLIWEPFAGSGTTCIASVTCEDWHLEKGKFIKVKAPRHGIGCDAMKDWALIAKYRIWEAQHPSGENVASHGIDELEKNQATSLKIDDGSDGGNEQENGEEAA